MSAVSDVVGTNLDLWTGIIGFFLPLVISVVEQTRWSDALRSWAAFVICVVAAAGTAYFSGNLNTTDVIRASLIIVTIAMTTYRGIWKPTGIAPAIEKATEKQP
jgi:hypothetical protein